MGVSENSGTPKSSILRGFSIINHPFWGTPIFGKTHISPSHGFFSAKKHQQRRQGAEVGSNLRHSHGSKDIPQEKQGSLNGTPKHRSMHGEPSGGFVYQPKTYTCFDWIICVVKLH